MSGCEFEKNTSVPLPLPSLNECETVTKKEKLLKSRTAQQLKLFVSNQIKKKSIRTGSTNCAYETSDTPEKICEIPQGNVTPQKKTSSVPSNSTYETQEGGSSDPDSLDSESDSDSSTSLVYGTKRSREASKTFNEPSNKDTHVLTLKNRGFITPMKSAGIVRRTWSTPEKLVARKHFQKCIDQNALPSLNECETVVKEEKVLKSRTAQQLKLFVSNQIKKKSICAGTLSLC